MAVIKSVRVDAALGWLMNVSVGLVVPILMRRMMLGLLGEVLLMLEMMLGDEAAESAFS